MQNFSTWLRRNCTLRTFRVGSVSQLAFRWTRCVRSRALKKGIGFSKQWILEEARIKNEFVFSRMTRTFFNFSFIEFLAYLKSSNITTRNFEFLFTLACGIRRVCTRVTMSPASDSFLFLQARCITFICIACNRQNTISNFVVLKSERRIKWSPSIQLRSSVFSRRLEVYNWAANTTNHFPFDLIL